MSSSLLLAWSLLALQTALAQRCSESDVELNSVNFLQMGVAALASSKANQCLRFMHIPKTGGTSIDSANMHLEPGHRAFDSLMLRTYMRIGAALGRQDLGELYETSHKGRMVYGGFLMMNGWAYRWLTLPGPDTCEDLHTPPSQSTDIAQYYEDANCTTFCAVREPLGRFLSAFKMVYQDCDPQAIEARTFQLLSELSTRPYVQDCFFVPQVESVYGAPSKAAATHQYCQRIIHQENLTQEFTELMSEYGRNVELPNEDLMSNWTAHCSTTVDDLTPATKRAVYEHYKEDYVAFGYPKPAF